MVQAREIRTKRWGKGRYVPKRRVCSFCKDKVVKIDYKTPVQLQPYISDRGKMEPRRRTGTCAKHQRLVAIAIKRARHLAMLPYVPAHVRKTGGVGVRS